MEYNEIFGWIFTGFFAAYVLYALVLAVLSLASVTLRWMANFVFDANEEGTFLTPAIRLMVEGGFWISFIWIASANSGGNKEVRNRFVEDIVDDKDFGLVVMTVLLTMISGCIVATVLSGVLAAIVTNFSVFLTIAIPIAGLMSILFLLRGSVRLMKKTMRDHEREKH